MRITNNMINKNSMRNINSNKLVVDFLNTQMTTQKKISRPSEDPVVAIRALRLRSNLNELNQYYEKNIPDAESWLEITEGALNNMKTILTDVYSQCVNGSTDTLNQEDRNAILKNLQSLREQIYEEGNANYAGRTVFTGYKTNSRLTFGEDDTDATYEITERLSFNDITEKKYYADKVDVPEDIAGIGMGVLNNDMPKEATNYRLRLTYDQIKDKNNSTLNSFTYTDKDGNVVTEAVTAMPYDAFEANDFAVDPDEILFIPETGELVFGSNKLQQIQADKGQIEITYNKTGFKTGEIRPEHYFDCTNLTDPNNPITFVKENQAIEYTVAFNQKLVVNTQAADVFDASIGRDVDELAEAVSAAIAAHDKVDKIKSMMKEVQYGDKQEELQQWLEAAEKEADFADDNMQKLYSNGVEDFQKYLDKVTLANTDLGSRADRLELTKARMSTQQEAFEKLKSNNEDKEISQIIIEYSNAYVAYEASTKAAAKAGQQSLLDYI